MHTVAGKFTEEQKQGVYYTFALALASSKHKEAKFWLNKVAIENHDKKLGQYSLITSLVETDKGSVEMIYDEGYRGNNALETSSKFLTENLGISSLILRSLIFLDTK